MEQRRFWPRRVPRRVRKIELSKRGVYEPVETEEDVLGAVYSYLWRCGIPVFRIRERVPNCRKCGASVSKPSDAGHPDLHGYVPLRALTRWAKPDTFAGQKSAVPFYIEMKRPKGGVKRFSQIAFITRLDEDKVLGFFARGVDEVRTAFAGIGIYLPDQNTYSMEARS